MVFGADQPFPPSVGSFQVPVVAPDSDPDEGDQVTVCFSATWLPLVIGALQQLTLQATWQGDTATIQAAQDRAQLLIAMFGGDVGGCTGSVCIKGLIYDSDCDCIKQTLDGGETYFENPGADPRHNTAYQFPPVEADDPRCQAAANQARYFSDLIDQVVLIVDTAGTAEGVMAIILPFVVELGPFGILIELVLGVAFTLFSAGALAISSAFTSTVFDDLTCIFYCNISLDGSVTADQLSTINSQVIDAFPGLVSTVLGGMFLLMGEVGLSNAGTIGDAPADCDDCGCAWCSNQDATNLLDEWIPHAFGAQPVATWDGTKWVGSGSVWISWTFGTPITLTDAAVLAYTSGGGNCVIYMNGDGSDVFSGTQIWANGAVVGTPFPATVDRLDVSTIWAFHSDTLEISEMQFSGNGDSPFGDSNC